jgi:hypothetical protein
MKTKEDIGAHMAASIEASELRMVTCQPADNLKAH